MAERELPKLLMWVRFPSPAPLERLQMDPLIFCVLIYVVMSLAANTVKQILVFGAIFGSAIYIIVLKSLSIPPTAFGIAAALTGGIILLGVSAWFKKGFLKIWRRDI